MNFCLSLHIHLIFIFLTYMHKLNNAVLNYWPLLMQAFWKLFYFHFYNYSFIQYTYLKEFWCNSITKKIKIPVLVIVATIFKHMKPHRFNLWTTITLNQHTGWAGNHMIDSNTIGTFFPFTFQLNNVLHFQFERID